MPYKPKHIRPQQLAKNRNPPIASYDVPNNPDRILRKQEQLFKGNMKRGAMKKFTDHTQPNPHKKKPFTASQILHDAALTGDMSYDQAERYLQRDTQGRKEFFKYQQYGLKKQIESAAFNKLVNQKLKTKHLGPEKRGEVVVTMLYDDFFTNIKDKAKKYWHNNKDQLLSMLGKAVTTYGPSLLAAIGSQNHITSSDPYSTSHQYIRHMGDFQYSHPAPRTLPDSLATMSNFSSYPIITSPSGDCRVIICPQSLTADKFNAGLTDRRFNYFAQSSNNITTVGWYDNASQQQSPFFIQGTNMSGWLPDAVKTRFRSAETMLSAKGKIYCNVFYQVPNRSFEVGSDGTVNGLTIAIQQKELLNNKTKRQIQVVDCVDRCQVTGSWYANGQDLIAKLYPPLNQTFDARGPPDSAFIVLFFTGCTPSSVIGSLQVRSQISFKPISSQIGIFDTKVRGSYPGTINWFNAMRKLGIPVQFMTKEEIAPYAVNNFANLRSIIGSQQDGYCIDQALKTLGLPTFGRPWVTVKQLQTVYPGKAFYCRNGYPKPPPRRLVVDLATQHAWVSPSQVKIGSQLANFTFRTNSGRLAYYRGGNGFYLYGPFQAHGIQDYHLIQGSTHSARRFSSRSGQWQSYPQKVQSNFFTNINMDHPLLYGEYQLQISTQGFKLIKGEKAFTVKSLKFLQLIPFIDSLVFDIVGDLGVSDFDIQKLGSVAIGLDQDGLQCSEQDLGLMIGSDKQRRTNIPLRESDQSKKIGSQKAFKQPCPDCTNLQSVLCSRINSGYDVSELKTTCRTCEEDDDQVQG